jgi:hypothetical protein
MANWWDGLVAPFAPAKVSGYDFGAPCPAGGWVGNGNCYGWPTHLGSDFGTPAGESIASPGPGVVTYKTGQVGYGNELIDKLANGYTFIFGHVASGISGPVAAGQQIGTTGANVGDSKGAVTLVQVLNPSGTAINPDPILGSLSSQPASLTGVSIPGVGDVGAGLGSLGGSIAGIPASIGHGLADFFSVAEQDIAAWLANQAVAAFVAVIVLLALFL